MIVIKIINLLTTSGQEICLVSNAIGVHLVGRNPSCDIVIDNPLVSNVHGMFIERDNSWYYLDLLPTNPSHLNNLEIKVNQHYPLKTRDSVCIGDFLLVVANIKVTATISRQVNNLRIGDTVPDLKENTVYLCGSDAIEANPNPLSESLDFLMENYYQDSFSTSEPATTIILEPTIPSPAPPLEPSVKTETSTSPLVVFSTSGKEIDHEGDESILQLGEQQSIPIKSSCKRGICGICKLKKIEGEVKYQTEPKALTAGQKKAGFILACIAHPVGRVVVKA
jgi:ferredoxin/pSer/pThr/pTyr-binding forkhead associated (FHA) protein